MKYLKLIILFLIFWNLPSYFLVNIGPVSGTILSYSFFFLVIVYYVFSEKDKPIFPFIILGLLYFLISVLVDAQYSEALITSFVKYFIFVIMGISVVKDVKDIEIYIVLLLGSLSIIYESIFIVNIGGRHSGFYINPNLAGCACIIGYCLSFSINNKKLKIIGQLVLSIAGLVTFSRTFLLIWVLVNIFSLSVSYKNMYKIVIGVILFSLFVSYGEKLDFNTRRLEAFSSILDGKISDDLVEDSRTESWALYYDKIFENPFFGNGYLSFSGKTYGEVFNSYSIQGVHNTFLMIIGEAGIVALLYFIWILGGFLVDGIKNFKEKPLVFLVSFSLILYMLTSHNYFDNYILLFISLWLYVKTHKKDTILDEEFAEAT